MKISIRGVSKRFKDFAALDNVSLDIQSGELIALLGPSGSGKTTLLRVIAGLEWPDAGEVYFDGQDALTHSVAERNVGFVFQHYALFRHMSIFENVAFGLRAQKRRERLPERDIRARVEELLDLVQLRGIADHFPSQLSGGQRQRIALARALAIEPRVLLLDEPFGALDAKVRKELRRWLRQLHNEIQVTSVFVTHDQEEALEVADRVVVLDGGRIEQVGTPESVYVQPASAFVHEFIGETNRLPVRVESGRVFLAGKPIALDSLGAPSGNANLYIRPHDLDIVAEQSEAAISGTVQHIHGLGAARRIQVSVNDGAADHLIEIEAPRALKLAAGQRVGFNPKNYRIFS